MNEVSNILKNKLSYIPSLPGIYKMLDSQENIIYVGKSKCLKKRVNSYFVTNHKWEKIKKMMALIRDIEYEVTDTHLEARLLECKLIKTLQPTFNSQMKNDGRYAYLQVKDYNTYNPLSVVQERSDYTYGPIRNKHLLIELADFFKNLYPIKFDGYSYDFEYHIFPITMDRITFDLNKEVLIDMFSRDERLSLFIEQLEDNMKDAASTYHYETASMYRDMIGKLEYVKHGFNGYRDLFSKKIVLKIPTEDGVKLFYVNKGNILLTKKYKRISLLNKYIEKFIDKGNDIKIDNAYLPDDKGSIDYRDILYSEINSLDEDMVLSLN